MESYRTEEEQVEALRKWWDENGKSTVAAVVVALGLGFGWQGWQAHQVDQAESASAIYQDLLQASNVVLADATLNAENRVTAGHLARKLKNQYSGSTYAQFAAMLLARFAVEEGDLDTAAAELRWVLTQSPADEVQQVAQLRLARVVASQGAPQAGLDMLVQNAGAYEALYAEARGDFFMQLGETEQALASYLEASAMNQMNGLANTTALDLKLQSLQLQQPRELEVLATEPAEETDNESS